MTEVVVAFGIYADEPNVTEEFIGVFANKEAWDAAKGSYRYYDSLRSEQVGVEGEQPEVQRYNPNNPDTDW